MKKKCSLYSCSLQKQLRQSHLTFQNANGSIVNVTENNVVLPGLSDLSSVGSIFIACQNFIRRVLFAIFHI